MDDHHYRIIFAFPNGKVGVIIPTDEAIKTFGIFAIATKDVPPGVPFKIVRDSDIPSDYTFFDAWEIDPSTVYDGVGSDSYEFPEPK